MNYSFFDHSLFLVNMWYILSIPEDQLFIISLLIFCMKGDLESFENSRKRKAASMGWCRICKVDCETVEGLDLHSQTREHQKIAMDMVRSIKQQNAKKQKM